MEERGKVTEKIKSSKTKKDNKIVFQELTNLTAGSVWEDQDPTFPHHSGQFLRRLSGTQSPFLGSPSLDLYSILLETHWSVITVRGSIYAGSSTEWSHYRQSRHVCANLTGLGLGT